MLDRDETRRKVMAGLKKLSDRGTRPENIAVNLAMSYVTIKNWMAGRRIPKPPTIRQIESIYGIKIL
jgi:ribosome-binding protein aMBF1 (putative translation factor)